MSPLLRTTASESSCVVAVDKERRWYAAYTRANHEKRVAEELALRSVEIFLPLYQEVRQWKDRRRRISSPLFAGYVFARIAPESRSVMHQITGFVRLVGVGNVPTPLCDQQIEGLRLSLSAGAYAEPVQQPLRGRHVRINDGPFAGFRGFVVRQRKSYRLVVSIDLIQRTILVDVDPRSIVIEKSKLDAVVEFH